LGSKLAVRSELQRGSTQIFIVSVHKAEAGLASFKKIEQIIPSVDAREDRKPPIQNSPKLSLEYYGW
jgi:hypothetical protein